VDPQTRGRRPIVWPAYLVAAVCFALAVALSIFNLSLIEQLKSAQTQLAALQSRASVLVHDLSDERGTIADVMDESAQRFDVPGGQVVRVHGHVYLTLHDMTQPPRGKVYQAWTMKNGGAFAPSMTFVPDAHGVAVIAVSADAKDVDGVELTVEPEGGSKTPTGTPLFLQKLT
jgi:hypothetical protein